jgi:hypothetical protein
MFRKSLILTTGVFAILWLGPAQSFQVAGSGSNYSNHSYEQAPVDTMVQQEVLPTIIHFPVEEATKAEDFHIMATVENLGLGVPVVHYRFGDSPKYSKNVMKPIQPDVYDFKILAAALSESKISYYIEVVDGSRTLANFGTVTQPVIVGLKSSGHSWLYTILAFALVGAFFMFRAIKSSRKDEPEINKVNKQIEALKRPTKSGKFARSHSR